MARDLYFRTVRIDKSIIPTITYDERELHFEMMKRIEQKLLETNDNIWCSLLTKNGKTQLSGSRAELYVTSVLDNIGWTYNIASSQQPYDIRNVNDTNLYIDIKKTDNTVIMFNDTLPHPDVWYIIFVVRLRRIIVCRGDDLYGTEYENIFICYETIMSLRQSYVKCGSFRMCPRINLSRKVNDIVSTKRVFKSISLFSGMGGDTLGMELAGFRCVAFSENNKECIKVHTDNFPNSIHITNSNGEADITKIPDTVFSNYKDVDLVFAGFPCQGFSHAGNKRSNDPRNRLFYEFVRVTFIINPRFIIGENVPGLLKRKTDDGNDTIIDKIKYEFLEIGYYTKWKILDSTSFGVPQTRKRLIIVGFREKQDYDKWNWDSLMFKKPPILKDILQTSFTNAIEFNETICPAKDTMYIESGIPDGTPHPYVLKKVKDGEISYSKRASPTHSQILNPVEPCKTIISTYGRMPRLLVSIRTRTSRYIREMLPCEGVMIQGFPLDFKLQKAKNDISKWSMIGNAIPPPIVVSVAECLRRLTS